MNKKTQQKVKKKSGDLIKNILDVVNKICNSKFQTKNFDHKPFYNLKKNRIEMHLISKKNFTLKINKKNIKFIKDETIHTENSHKYSKNNFLETKWEWEAFTGGFLKDRNE